MRAAALALLAALVAAPVAGGQESGAVVELEDPGVGFLPSGDVPNLPMREGTRERLRFVARDGWAPFQAVLRNRGDAIDGVLRVRPTFRNERNPVEWSKRVSLPRGAAKRVSFPVLENTIASFDVTFETDASGPAQLIHPKRPGAPPEAKQERSRVYSVGQSRTIRPDAETVLVATESAGSFAHFLLRKHDGALAADRVVVPVASATLPWTALEYDAVDVVVLDDVPVDGLSAAQQEALHQFACRGGVLVVCLDRNAARVRGTVIEAILPGVPGEPVNVRGMAALEVATGASCRLTEPRAVMTFAARPGAERWGSDEATIVHGRIDRGTVVAVGFPLSARFLEGWPGSQELMSKFTGAARKPRIAAPGTSLRPGLRQDAAAALKGSVAKSLPPFPVVLAIMIGYAVLVVVLPFGMFRPLRRLEWAWAAVLLIALAGSGVVYGVGTRHLRGQSAAYRVTVVEGGAHAGAHLRHSFWCVFTPKGERLSLGFDDRPVPYPFGGELALRGTSEGGEAMRASYDEDAQIRGMRTYAQDTVLFETTGACLLPGALRFSAVANGAKVAGSLDRVGGMPLHAAWIAWNDRLTPVREGAFVIDTDAPLAADPGADGSRTYRDALSAVRREAQQWSRDARRPVMLYRYEGEPSLSHAGLPEEGWHFGIIEAEAADEPLPPRLDWRSAIRRPYDETHPDEGAEVSLTAWGLPRGRRVHGLTLECSMVPAPDVEMWNLRTKQWHKVRVGALLVADEFVIYSPIGQPHARVRLRVPVERRKELLDLSSGSVSAFSLLEP